MLPICTPLSFIIFWELFTTEFMRKDRKVRFLLLTKWMFYRV
jgi:hypothetical protein